MWTCAGHASKACCIAGTDRLDEMGRLMHNFMSGRSPVEAPGGVDVEVRQLQSSANLGGLGRTGLAEIRSSVGVRISYTG